MSGRIYKYSCGSFSNLPQSEFMLPLTENAECLDVQLQDGRPVIWCISDPMGSIVTVTFMWLWTGHDLPKDSQLWTWIKTLQAPDGLVWHLFRKH